MKRIGFLLKVKTDKTEEYKKHHENVWSEMREALSRRGWHNCPLFMQEDGLLFGYFPTPHDFDAALGGMEQEPINALWQEFMAPYFESTDGAHPDKTMVELEEIFHLE